VLSRRALRRRRLSRGDPGQRITGAWYEFTDALRLAGRPVPPHLAASEAAAFAETAAFTKTATAASAQTKAFAQAAALSETTASTQAPAFAEAPALAATRARAAPPGGKAPAAKTRAQQAVPGEPSRGLRPATPHAGSPPALPPLDELVAGVNTVAFAPGAADSQQAERAAAQAVAYADALRDRRSWWRRVWWRLHPGPLLWHRR
jgi:hypothetical protein